MRTATIFGASGHTGKFVVREFLRRGWKPILAGRDAAKLRASAGTNSDLECRVATIDDDASLDRALAGADVVINCAGPFGETAPALIEAAIRARIHYVDITGETLVTLDSFGTYGGHGPAANRVRDAGIVVAPAVGFFGALGDLLATMVMGDWTSADEITIAVALDSWKPTQGTRLAGARRAGRRVTFSNGRIEIHPADRPPPTGTWRFPAPFGNQEVVGELSTTDVITIAHHLKVPLIKAYLNKAPIVDLSDPEIPGPEAVDQSGRSSQIFAIEVVARRGSEERRASVSGRDIYAITAPIVAEMAERVLDGRAGKFGVVTAGELPNPRDFLEALRPDIQFTGATRSAP